MEKTDNGILDLDSKKRKLFIRLKCVEIILVIIAIILLVYHFVSGEDNVDTKVTLHFGLASVLLSTVVKHIADSVKTNDKVLKVLSRISGATLFCIIIIFLYPTFLLATDLDRYHSKNFDVVSGKLESPTFSNGLLSEQEYLDDFNIDTIKIKADFLNLTKSEYKQLKDKDIEVYYLPNSHYAISIKSTVPIDKK